jgi:hypothetical protein
MGWWTGGCRNRGQGRPGTEEPAIDQPAEGEALDAGRAEADAIEQAVERQKQRARDLRICETAHEAYGLAGQYLNWRDNEKVRDLIYPAVSDVMRLGEGRFQFRYDGETYAIGMNRRRGHLPDGDSYDVEEIEVLCGDRHVLQFDMYVDYDEFGAHRDVGDVQAFVDGPWVARLGSLVTAAAAHCEKVNAARAKEERENPERLSDLKRRFGL